MNSLEEVLSQAEDYEKKDRWDLASRCYFKALSVSPNNKDILYKLSLSLHHKGDYEQSFNVLAECFRHPQQTDTFKGIFSDHLLEAYYRPHELEFRALYQKNRRQFMDYEFNYISGLPEFDSLSYFLIRASDRTFYILKKETYDFVGPVTLDETPIPGDIEPDDCIMAVNVFKPSAIEAILNLSFNKIWENGYKCPAYFIWEDHDLLSICFQIFDYSPIIGKRSTFFFDNYNTDHFREFFMDLQSHVPIRVLGDNKHCPSLVQLLQEIDLHRGQFLSDKKNEIIAYYSTHNPEYYQELFADPQNMRILFYTTRFSDVVQYGTRDFMNACQKSGFSCEMLIEKSDLHWANNQVLITKIAEFKPDVIFRINYLKSDFGIFVDNLMFLTWIQDPVIQITSKEHVRQLGPCDYLMSHSALFMDQMLGTGYPRERILLQAVPMDETIFYSHALSENEKEQFSSDVAVCGNFNTNPEQIILDISAQTAQIYTDSKKQEIYTSFLKDIYDIMQEMVENDELITNTEQCRDIIDKVASRYPISYNPGFDQIIFLRLIYGLHRKDIVQALCRSGLKFNLWGKYWEQVPEFVPFCRGWVEHGEELAKVYSYSKIVIGTTSHYTAHIRIWEAIACGSLCMIRFIPPEFDYADIRDYLTEGDGFVFYHNKQDLLDKIRYYLDHEDERLQMVARGQKKVLEKLTYKAAVEKWLNFVKNDLNQRAAGERL